MKRAAKMPTESVWLPKPALRRPPSRAKIYQTWLERHVLIVRGQTLSKTDFLAYSRRFGRLKPHRVKTTRDPEHPEITLMGVTTGNNASDKLVLDRGQGWHTDGAWDVEICKATQLYALAIPICSRPESRP
jgi:taurine dioxygenase